MNWSDARRRLRQLATGRRRTLDARGRADGGGVVPGPSASDAERALRLVEPRALSVCVASGKGGTGKSVVSASLASLLASRGRTLIVDADLGVGNAHILQDVSPTTTFVDVVEGRARARDVVVSCEGNVDLLAAGSGVPKMSELSSYEMHLVAAGIEDLERDYQYLFVDSAAGVSPQTIAFACACDLVLLVTTPDLTAMTDAYALFKVLIQHRPDVRPLLLVNRVTDAGEALETSRRIRAVSQRFLERAPELFGWIPEDLAVRACVDHRGPVVRRAPDSKSAVALRRLSIELLEELGRLHPRGVGRRLVREVGFSRRFA